MIKILKRLEKKEFGLIAIIIVFIVAQVWLDLKLPDYMAEITTLIQQSNPTVSKILTPGFYMLLCAFGSLAFSAIAGFFAATVAASFSKKIRGDVFRKVESFGMEEVKKFSTSSLINRTTNDITQVQTLVVIGLQMIIKSPIMAIWAISKMASKSWQWSAITGGAVMVLILMITVLVLFALPKFKKIQTLTDNLNMVTREGLTGIRVIRAFNAEGYQENRFEKANKELTKNNMFTQRLMAIMFPVMTFTMSVLTLAIYFVGAYLIDAANMADKIGLFSNMIIFSSYAMQVVMAFMMLVLIFIIYPRSSVSAKRIVEVLNSESSIKDGTITKSKIKGTVEFKDVSFKYPDAEEYILKDISFTANKGEVIAFIGSTGSGKSTLINLIPRFYDVTEGKVLVDGVDVRDFKQEYLYNKIGYIPQKAVIFNDTVKNNVAYGSKVNEKEIKKAIKIAQGTEFVEKMANQYESHVAQGGNNISGGQKQRLAIARAIARNPEIYIFDDSFSALDYKTDYNLRKELKRYTKEVTTLIVAQRIGTIKNADKIIVLDKGSIVGIGTHNDLLKNCQVYKEIALSQLSKEELTNE